eukprot:jgi/Bigna1/147648/aug1.293_g22356
MDSKAEPSISPGAPAQSTWFGLVSMAVKKDLLTDLLAEHHSIPTGSMRMFKRVPLVDVHRAQMFDSVAEQILAAQPEELAAGINVQFENEIGMDSGGLTKEFFNLVCADLLPKGEEDQASSFDGYDGGAAAGAGGGRRRPLLRRQSSVVGTGEPMLRLLPDTSLMIKGSNRPIVFYKSLGRLIGMSLLYGCRGDNTTIPISLSTALLKFILSHEINHLDVRALDPVYFKNRIEFMLSEGGVEVMCSILDEEKLYFVDLDTDRELKQGAW